MQLLFLLLLSLRSCWKGDPQRVKGLAFCPALSSAGLWTKAEAREVFAYLGFFLFVSRREVPTSALGAVGLVLLSSWQWGSREGCICDTFFSALP